MSKPRHLRRTRFPVDLPDVVRWSGTVTVSVPVHIALDVRRGYYGATIREIEASITSMFECVGILTGTMRARTVREGKETFPVTGLPSSIVCKLQLWEMVKK
jgi:hypothetical protein